MYDDYLFFDIEVFKYNSMVVFKDIEEKTVKVFSSSLDGLDPYIIKGTNIEKGFANLKNYVKDKTLVGYNNHYYDDRIMKALMTDHAKDDDFRQKMVKTANDSIINNEPLGWLRNTNDLPYKSLDCFQQIDVSRPSLKKVEGNMGVSIIESSVPFDIDRELTPDENLETLKYCEYDVLNTVRIFKMRKDYYESKDAVINMLEDDYARGKAYKWNTTSIIASLLEPKKKAPAYRVLPSKETLSHVNEDVRKMWAELIKTTDYKFDVKKVVITEFGNEIEFGWGGLHGTPKGFLETRNVRLADVGSMYPSILINLNGLGDKTKQYKEILDYRLMLKHQGKKDEQAPYKLILNSTYGLLNNKYSSLNNPTLAYSICIHGQVAVYVLAKRLAEIGARVININTDGVAYTFNGNEDEIVKKEWEKEFKLNLETDYFDRWIQKDVNNYIAVTDKGKIKVKGGDVNKYHGDNFFKNNDIGITHKALVDYLVYDKPVQDTIIENLDNPRLFQYILQAGSTYKGVVTRDEPDKLLDTKVNRVFATKKGIEILKKRADDGLVKFDDTPGEMYLYNGELDDFKDFRKVVDMQWYYDLTMKNLQRWK
ncbi:hypothetical protein K8P03_04975 [Anaerococcus murdochii]|uniref:DNA-directed DNA polymerase n=1 Tax=Anaerococcus murdochii TaxID=411577 RepID=A0ABS7SYQ1_9FIRM|nr:hypothetical protein [Anaerococcus murdochii]MBZ2386650.1 hypothetical protein [Anaerococcus murdochii]